MTTTRIPALDGLRALSILLVLAAHLLPLGPARFQLNYAAGLMGMALFFCLSGFLIVRFLVDGMQLRDFVARRFARIVPLSWTAMTVLWLISGGDLVANLLFYSNLPPARLMEGGEHLWSLCVEVQFYAFVTLLCLVQRRRLLLILPALCVGVTGLRILSDQPVSIVTWHRVDEILAGGVVALVCCGWLGTRSQALLKKINFPVAIALLFICCHPSSGFLLYLRPYAAGLVLFSVIYELDRFSKRLLVNKPATYVAEISYALYVVHGMLAVSWLGTGDTIVKYLKRPILFAATFGLAHLSTFYFEKPITKLARKISGPRPAA